jgi:predicted transcriptional regulator
MEKAEHYLKLNRKYLKEAEELLDKGDSVQASEKLWGVAAEMVKSVAAKRGEELRTHADLWDFLTKLRKELNDPELIRLFAVANYLHQNFYEASMNVEAVKDSSEAVKQLIKKLEKAL